MTSNIEIGTLVRLKDRWTNHAGTTVYEVIDAGWHPRTHLAAFRLVSTTARIPQPRWVVETVVYENYDVVDDQGAQQ